MDPAAAASASPASMWRRAVRRRSSLGAAGARAREEKAAGVLAMRAEELAAVVLRLRAEKDAAERAAAVLRAELDAERGAAESAASETMLMIGRLQREKAAAMMEARQFRGLAEGRAGRDRELQDRLAAASAVVASYADLLRAHGVDPEEEEEVDSVEHPEAEADREGQDDGMVDKAAVVEVLEDTSTSPPAPPADEEFEHTVEVPCVAATKAAAVERVVAGVEGCLGLHARVEALEADRAAVRREVAALRAERAQVLLAREVARRLCRQVSARAAAVPAEAQRFSVLAICKWFISTILLAWGKNRSAARLIRIVRLAFRNRRLTNPSLGQPLLLERSNGDHRIHSVPSPSHKQMLANGEPGIACSERPWCSPL
ncbi:hypothetical protein ACP70R_014454 [Stipagrostis hirtigluma subsp. patula]